MQSTHSRLELVSQARRRPCKTEWMRNSSRSRELQSLLPVSRVFVRGVQQLIIVGSATSRKVELCGAVVIDLFRLLLVCLRQSESFCQINCTSPTMSYPSSSLHWYDIPSQKIRSASNKHNESYPAFLHSNFLVNMIMALLGTPKQSHAAYFNVGKDLLPYFPNPHPSIPPSCDQLVQCLE